MIQQFADWLVYVIFGLDAKSALGSSVNIFFYDTIKTLILLFLISAVLSIVYSYLPTDRLRRFLTERIFNTFLSLFSELSHRFARVHPCRCLSDLSMAVFRLG